MTTTTTPKPKTTKPAAKTGTGLLQYRATMKIGGRTVSDGTIKPTGLAAILNKWNTVVSGLAQGQSASFTIRATAAKTSAGSGRS
jgi:hypothetical protein